MFIKQLKLTGYGPFKEASIDLWSEKKPDRKITVLIGENGVGKSSILEALMTLLSWLPARIRNERNPGSPITELKINNDFSCSTAALSVFALDEDYSWSLSKTRKGIKAKTERSLSDVSNLAAIFSKNFFEFEDSSLPFIGYYPTERCVLDIPLKIRTKHSFTQIDGYDNALTRGIDFRRFFEWFRNREDIHNEGKVDFDEILPFIDIKGFWHFLPIYKQQKEFNFEEIVRFIDKDKLKKRNIALYNRIQQRDQLLNDPQYFAVLRALEIFMPGYSGLRIERKPRLRMVIDRVDKGRQTLDILQLSQGERSLLALVGDIARRLAIMNPGLPDPLLGEGVVLIDEIELHLHPRWQRTIIRHLRKTFPNCQFILTTHSPLVISDPDNIQVLTLKNGEIRELPNLYGMDVEQVFLEIMDTPLRHPALQKKIDALLEAIQDRELDKAKKLRQELAAILPPDHRELVRADIFLRRQTVLHAKNH
jgi:predicted ATP-binding protein involved in virulence